MGPSINTSITIAAPPSAVRRGFLDFASYPEWNPFITSMESVAPTPAKGTKLKFVAGGTAITSTIIDNTPESFSWSGELLGSWFFNGIHIFEFEPFGDIGADGETVGCKLVQKENSTGIAAGVLLLFIGGKTEEGFKDLNTALKARVEGTVATT